MKSTSSEGNDDSQPPSLVTSGGWLTLISIALLLLLLGLWAALGNIPRMVDGRGIIIRNSEVGILRMETFEEGILTRVHVKVGDLVKEGMPIAALRKHGIEEAETDIRSLHTGRVIEVIASAGDAVQPGSGIARLESDSGPYEALLYVSALEGKRVRQGMEGRLIFMPTHPSSHYAKARVTYVSPHPITREYLSKELGGDEQLVSWLLEHHATTEVVLEIIREHGNNASSFKVESGQLLNGTVTFARVRPISWFFSSRRE